MNQPHDGQPCTVHRLYRMGCAEYDALRARAAGHCEACGVPSEETPQGVLFIDHDHRYGFSAVRGLLCSRCNSKLGGMERAHNSILKIDRDPVFGPYVRNSWHLQVVHWGRMQDNFLGNPPPELWEFNELVLRFSTVRHTTRLLGMAPTVTTRGLVHPGYFGAQITATYEIGSHRGCSIHLRRTTGRVLKKVGFHVFENGSGARFTAYSGLADARKHLIKLMESA